MKVRDAIELYGNISFTLFADRLVFAGSEITGFVGDGPYMLENGDINPDATGLRIDNIEFGLVLYIDGSLEGGFAFTGSGTGAIINVPDLVLSGSVDLQVNTTGSAIDELIDTQGFLTEDPHIVFTEEQANYFAIEIGGTLQISNSFFASGSFLLEVDPSRTVTLNDAGATQEDVTLLTFIAKNVTGFAGINGPYDNGDGTTNDDAIGFVLSNMNFAVALMLSNQRNRNWYALKTTVGEVGIVGFEGVTLTGSDFEVEINQGSDGTVVDFTQTTLLVGDETFDYDGQDGPLLRLLGTVQIGFDDFVYLEGTFGFEKLEDRDITLVGGATANADGFLITGANISGFAGLNRGLENEIGVSVTDVDAGIAIFRENRLDELTTEVWTALKVAFDEATLSGGPDILSFEATNGLFELNLSTNGAPVMDLSAVEDNILFTEAGLTLDYSQELIAVSGTLGFNVVNGFSGSGSFGFSREGTGESQIIKVVADQVSALASVGEFKAGVTNGTLALFTNTDDTFALDVSGTPVLEGLDFNLVSVDSVRVQYNNTGVDYSTNNLLLDVEAYSKRLPWNPALLKCRMLESRC